MNLSELHNKPRKYVEVRCPYWLHRWECYWYDYYKSLKRKQKEGVKNAEK